MIRVASQPKSVKTAPAQKSAAPEWHEVFLRMAPAIKTHAKLMFKGLSPEAKAEAVQNVLCCACSAVARLAELGKLDLCYPSALANYAVAQTRDGRMVGGHLNCKDISSEYYRQRKDLVLERLDRYDTKDECWQEVLVPDQTCTPADLAATRIDFAAWLKTLKPQTRKIARFLSLGHRTDDTAKKFGLSTARISQLRQELKLAWELFIGERFVNAQ